MPLAYELETLMNDLLLAFLFKILLNYLNNCLLLVLSIILFTNVSMYIFVLSLPNENIYLKNQQYRQYLFVKQGIKM